MKKQKNFHRFLLLWLGSLVASVGSGMTAFGLSTYLYETTGQTAPGNLITLLAFLPSLILAPLAGVLADHFDRRLLMILGDGLSILGLAYILLTMRGGEIAFWQLALGVSVSSIFSALVQPAFQATVSDLLDEDEYAKASGLVQLAGAARFLLSPLIAAAIWKSSGIRLILLLDIATIFVTVLTTGIVRRHLPATPRPQEDKLQFGREFVEGFRFLIREKGILALTVVASLLTFFIGTIQTLALPMILAFTSEVSAALSQTICALGMLVSGLILGARGIKSGHLKVLSLSLFGAGLFMILFGAKEQLIWITVAGFLFFATLPFANASLDYLVRSNLPNRLQGRLWGLIGTISQMGYIFSYAVTGFAADRLFVPRLMPDGAWASSIGHLIGVGPGRGIGFTIMFAGFWLALSALLFTHLRSVRELAYSHKLDECSAEIGK